MIEGEKGKVAKRKGRGWGLQRGDGREKHIQMRGDPWQW